ncbi:MAG: PEP/pyruvate-binding domain-containing protein [Holophaga sp.]|nr:PEP/pyruvate-binding domain-containing protein [Holophaga sp.]
MSDPTEPGIRFGKRMEQFSGLMPYRVFEILLVATTYDAFILEEDGQLNELLVQEMRDLGINLRGTPRIVTVTSGREGLALLAAQSFDMVITTARLADLTIEAFAREAKDLVPRLPVGVLAVHPWEVPVLDALRAAGQVDWVFLWLGDVKSLFAMIKQQEDRRNADHDVLDRGVRAIIVVEDDVRFYSFFLPHIYAEVTHQTSRLLVEGLNLTHRILRMRARPKILLAQSYEEAWGLFERFGEHLLGIISDVSYPREGRMDPAAGIELARQVRWKDPDLPILLQSVEPIPRGLREELGVVFLPKEAPAFLADLRTFMLENFGFGDFIFRLPDRTEVARAADLRQLLAQLELVPDASIEYHASRDHFSQWYAARTEFALAEAVKPVMVSHFPSIGGLREHIRASLLSYIRDAQRTIISDFDSATYDEFVTFAKMGSGSLGGKGRGLAFMQKLLALEDMAHPGVEVAIPRTLAVASDVFEGFLERNGLGGMPYQCAALSDEAILDAFRQGRFDRAVRGNLARFLTVVRTPLAVRSSSILEDSLYQPFAGVYATLMLTNSHPSLDVRLAQLLEALKVVYASTYMKGARDYLETTPHRLEEERMAVVLQTLVGTRRQDRHFPTFSGVTSSYNFYPFRDMVPADGIALTALGLGKAVVEGFEALRFCPAQPQVLPQFSAVKDILRNAQRKFWALDMTLSDVIPGMPFDANLVEAEVTRALGDPAFAPIASTFLPADDRIVDGIQAPGTPLVTFSRILKGQGFPLPRILTRLLQITEACIGVPVEIEFAVDLKPRDPQTFHVLQIRPMHVERVPLPAGSLEPLRAGAVVFSRSTLGHGRRGGIRDVIAIPWDLDRARTREAAQAVEAINRGLRQEGRPSLIIGPGRWGSADPWLGIPVTWPQISTARAIVETDFQDLEVDPSQGSHFFHNLTAFGVAYFTIHRRGDDGAIAWDWLGAQPLARTELDGRVRHYRLDEPLEVLVDGARGLGAVVPEARE